MIRTFLIYSIIDQCLNVMFSQVDRLFASPKKFVVGQKFSSVVCRMGDKELPPIFGESVAGGWGVGTYTMENAVIDHINQEYGVWVYFKCTHTRYTLVFNHEEDASRYTKGMQEDPNSDEYMDHIYLMGSTVSVLFTWQSAHVEFSDIVETFN